MRDLIITALILSPLPAVLVRPHLGALLWLWVSYMNPHRLTWGFAYNFQFAMIIGVVTMGAWLLSREPKRVPWTTTTALLVAFTLWISLTTAFAAAPALAFPKWDRTIKIMVGVFLVLGLLQGRQRLIALTWVTAGSIAFYGVKGGLFVIATAGRYRVSGPEDSFIADNNQAAVALLMVLPLLRYLQQAAPRRWMRLALLAAMALTLLAILGTYSRGAIIGLAAVVLMLWLKSRHKAVLGAVIGISIGLAVAFMPPQWMDRIHSTSDYQEDASAQGRLDAWAHAMTVAVERPLTGGGFGTFSPEVFQRYSPGITWRAAHSIYFEVLGEQGFIGLALFLAIGITAYRSGTWIHRRVRGRPDLAWAGGLAQMLQVGLVAYGVGGAFLSLGYFDLYYGLVAMLVLTRAAVAQQLGARAPSSPLRLRPLAVAGGASPSGGARPREVTRRDGRTPAGG